MPGRMFTALAVPGGTYSGTTQVNGYTLPVDLTLSTRSGNQPTSYVATDLIDLNDGFESGTNDDVTAYIADGSYAGGGNGDGSGVAGTSKYRYGFNGKEQDDEVKGLGDQIDYGKRIYDPRVARFLSTDPLTRSYPELTPYQYAGNSPITFIDQDGLEFVFKMPDGSLYFQPPSDHNRVPIPTAAIPLPVNTGTHSGDGNNVITSTLAGGLNGWNTFITGKNMGDYRNLVKGPDGKMHWKKANFHDYVQATQEVVSFGTLFDGGEGEGASPKEPGALHGESPSAPKLSKPAKDEAGLPTTKSQEGANGGRTTKGNSTVNEIKGGSKEEKTIGLGIDEDLAFHRGTGAITYKKAGWQKAGLTKVDWGKAAFDEFSFKESFRDAAQNADAITFDVTNFNLTPAKRGVTNYEFDYIISNENLFNKTTFKSNGQDVKWDGAKFVKP